ncbi:hypothetical protein ABGB18_01895 [Nonomuraea sp. B12E4]|uniref:hypothetical protein n=1 Tax=Nonomuraea sp. B12E4 TaxID=3153564 RepID=UPI00325E8EE0
MEEHDESRAADLVSDDYGVRSVAEAPETSATMTVVVDERGSPRWVVGPEGAGPAVAVAPGVPVLAILSDVELLETLGTGLPGLVVLDEGRLTGVIRRQALETALSEGLERELSNPTPSDDATLHGPREDLVASAGPLIRCRVCGLTHAYRGYLPTDRTVCKTPVPVHDLVPEWDTSA